jgi:hypothetical protein
LRQCQKLVEWGAGTGGEDIDGMGWYGLDTAVVDQYRRVCDSCCFAQERAFTRVGLDQFDPGHAEDREDQAGEAGATAEIDEARGLSRDEAQELCRVEKMPAPDIIKSVASYEIDARRPALQQIGIGSESRQCFT